MIFSKKKYKVIILKLKPSWSITFWHDLTFYVIYTDVQGKF